jgi:hypothetical protein
MYIPKNTISLSIELIGAAGLKGEPTTPAVFGGNGGYIYCNMLSGQVKQLRGKNLILSAGSTYSRASYIKIEGGNTIAIAGAGGGAGLISGVGTGSTITGRQGSGGNGGGLNGLFNGNIADGSGIEKRLINGVEQYVIIGSDGTSGTTVQRIGGGGSKGGFTAGGAAGVGTAPNGEITFNGESGKSIFGTSDTIASGGDGVINQLIGTTGQGGQGYTGGGSGGGAYNQSDLATTVYGGGGGGSSYINASLLDINTFISYGGSNTIPSDKLTGYGRSTSGSYIGFIRVMLTTAC